MSSVIESEFAPAELIVGGNLLFCTVEAHLPAKQNIKLKNDMLNQL